MSKEKLVLDTYKIFCAAEGNQHIAIEYAVKKLQGIIDTFGVENVLEVGLGIGAIAGSLLSAYPHLEYTGTEDNEFCLNALKRNLGADYKKLEVFSKLSKVPHRKYDLIIIDGKDSGSESIQQLVLPSGIIAIEGDRKPQLNFFEIFFLKNRIVHCISLQKNKIYSPHPSREWQGGLKLCFLTLT